MADFKLNTERPSTYQSGEERTFYCKVIIPLFKSLEIQQKALLSIGVK